LKSEDSHDRFLRPTGREVFLNLKMSCPTTPVQVDRPFFSIQDSRQSNTNFDRVAEL
jgi:hypothetical protein